MARRGKADYQDIIEEIVSRDIPVPTPDDRESLLRCLGSCIARYEALSSQYETTLKQGYVPAQQAARTQEKLRQELLYLKSCNDLSALGNKTLEELLAFLQFIRSKLERQ